MSKPAAKFFVPEDEESVLALVRALIASPVARKVLRAAVLTDRGPKD